MPEVLCRARLIGRTPNKTNRAVGLAFVLLKSDDFARVENVLGIEGGFDTSHKQHGEPRGWPDLQLLTSCIHQVSGSDGTL